MQNSFDLKTLRQRLCQRRRSLSEAVVANASRGVCDQLAVDSAFLQAQVVALYYPVHGEISPLPLLASFPDKTFALPVTLSAEEPLCFYRYAAGDELVSGSFGIPEPQPLAENQTLLQHIDLMVVPMVAFDANNNRLGHGAGHYDRTLADPQTRPTLIGVAYEWQRVPELPIRPWDVPMDAVVTDSKIQ